MIITCEECQARFRLADEKLKPGGTKVRCSKCRHVFTVMPPEPEPAEETVDFGAFNMEPVAEEEPATAAAPSELSIPDVAPAAAGDDLALDFSGLAGSMGPGAGDSELTEEFSFADTSAPADTSSSQETAPAAPVSASDELDFVGGGASGELDFDATFAETDEPPAIQPSLGPAEFAFNTELSEAAAPADSATFSFETEPAVPTGEATPPPAPGEFGLEAELSAATTEEFSFATEPTSELGDFGFETEAGGEGPAFDQEPALGEEGSVWDQPAQEEGASFDFDEPSFETKTGKQAPKSDGEASLGFGEIDFSEGSSETAEFGEAPSFGAEPDFSQATMSRPVETPPPPPPPPRPAPSPSRGEAPLPVPARPRKSPLSRVVLLLALMLLALCGAGGYFYFMGDGQRMVENLLLKVKGEVPAAPVEQRIGLKIAGSSYVDNRDAGQLLVIQGSATNNFAGHRSAITVKGLLLNAGGKILQQQTVFCGNYLSEEKLRTMKYAQIEEAMNNQFGDSLANMNVKPGVELRFTIVFRNLPKEMANINVEVVDSKAGGL